MAMNKKEAARLKAAESAIPVLLALGWPQSPRPLPVDVNAELKDKPWGTRFIGWHVLVYRGQAKVSQGGSSGHGHSIDRTDRTTSQGQGTFYRHKIEALIAARWELCEELTKELAKIDKEIDDERRKQHDDERSGTVPPAEPAV